MQGHTELAHHERWSVPLSVGALVYLATTAQLSRQVRTWSMNEIRLRSDNARLMADLSRQATHDPLTGVANRTLFFDRVRAVMASPERAETPFAVVYLDLDDFKQVNDRLGHGAGDELLCDVARRIQASVRPTDLVARVAGDEFTILLTPIDDANAGAIAERVRNNLAHPHDIAGTTVTVPVSVGVVLDDGTSTPEHLVALADAALYRAKQAGKNRVELGGA